jgi:hypothetical protein
VDDLVVELASYADIEGIDWATLNAQGQGILESDHYQRVLEARWEAFYAVAETLAITDAEWEETTAEQARDAWKEVYDEISAKAGVMLDAITSGELLVAYDHAATLWSGSLKKLVIATSHVSHYNLTAHEDGTMYWAIETGAMTVAEVEEEASACARLWDCVVKLDEWGALSSLKKPEHGGPAGVGAIQIPAAAIVIAAVGIAAVIASVVVFAMYLSDRNSRIDKFCFDENGELAADRPAWCDEPGQGQPDPLAIFLKPFTEAGKRLATGLTIVAGIAVTIWLGSMVAPKLLEASAKRRTA